MTGTALAILVAVIGVVASVIWFGVLRRRKAETELGVHALANMKWRDCINVVLEALHRDGYERSAVSQVPAGGATEVMLSRNGRDVLLEYKHGTAYHLTDANVREFVNNVSLNGAREGILVTLGTVGPDASRVAATHAVQLIDGPALWPKVRHFLLPTLLDNVRRQAAARTRNGLWAGAATSILAGVALFVLYGDRVDGPSEAVVADHEVPALRIERARVPALRTDRPGVPGADAEMMAKISATAKALEEIAKMTPEQLSARRAEAAKRVSELPRVGSASWSAQRTLVVNVNQAADDAKDSQLFEEVCRILVNNEEMRFTRVQLEFPSEGDQRVRWRLCE